MTYLKKTNTSNIHIAKTEGGFDVNIWTEITESDYDLLIVQKPILSDLVCYLYATDHWPLKNIDDPGYYTAQMQQDRIDCRTAFDTIEAYTTIAEVEAYDISKYENYLNSL